MTAGVSGPAHADEIDDLQARLAELDGEIAAADAELATLEDALRQINADLAITSATLELTADEYARTVETRRGPAGIRHIAAIQSYVRGDPRSEALLEELQGLGNDSTPAIRAELFSAVIDETTDDLAAIDAALVALGDEVVSLQGSRTEHEQLLATTQARFTEVTVARQALVTERAEVEDRIEFLRSLVNRPVLTGLPGANPDRPALVVKIDNVDPARPQAGINQADIVYEELVEGGLTRLAAVFHSTDVPRVGPVRSARTTDIELLANLDRPLLASSGANGGTRDLIGQSSLVSIGHPDSPQSYFRDNGRSAPHNLFSTTADLWALDGGRGGRPSAQFTFRAPEGSLPPSARPARGLAVRFERASISYSWDGSGWARTQNGRAHVDAGGVGVSPENVIVQFIEYGTSPADANSPEAHVTGEGDAWIFTAGAVIEGRWRRDSAGDRTVFTDPDGNEVTLTPGRTWVELAEPGTGTIS